MSENSNNSQPAGSDVPQTDLNNNFEGPPPPPQGQDQSEGIPVPPAPNTDARSVDQSDTGSAPASPALVQPAQSEKISNQQPEVIPPPLQNKESAVDLNKNFEGPQPPQQGQGQSEGIPVPPAPNLDARSVDQSDTGSAPANPASNLVKPAPSEEISNQQSEGIPPTFPKKESAVDLNKNFEGPPPPQEGQGQSEGIPVPPAPNPDARSVDQFDTGSAPDSPVPNLVKPAQLEAIPNQQSEGIPSNFPNKESAVVSTGLDTSPISQTFSSKNPEILRGQEAQKEENKESPRPDILTASPVAPPLLIAEAAKEASSEASISPLHSSTENSIRTRSKRSSSSWKNTENCSYSIVVRTSKERKAGTNANVFVQLTDQDGVQTDKLRLKCSITHRQKFRRGHSDLFLLVDQNQLSNLKYVDVWHQKKKAGATWLLHSINVIEHHTHQLYRFPYCKTIGDDDETTDISHARLDVVGEPVRVLTAENFQITG